VNEDTPCRWCGTIHDEAGCASQEAEESRLREQGLWYGTVGGVSQGPASERRPVDYGRIACSALAVLAGYLTLAKSLDWPRAVTATWPVLAFGTIGLFARFRGGLNAALVARILRSFLGLRTGNEHLAEFRLQQPSGGIVVSQLWSAPGALAAGQVIAVAGHRRDVAGVPRLMVRTIFLRDTARPLVAGVIRGWQPWPLPLVALASAVAFAIWWSFGR